MRMGTRDGVGHRRRAKVRSVRLVTELACSQVVARPVVAKVDDRPGRVWSRCLCEGGGDDGRVGLLVSDRAEREAEWVLDEARQGGPYDLGDLAYLGDRYRRETPIVEHALEQSDRLLADWSGGDEEHEVDGV